MRLALLLALALVSTAAAAQEEGPGAPLPPDIRPPIVQPTASGSNWLLEVDAGAGLYSFALPKAEADPGANLRVEAGARLGEHFGISAVFDGGIGPHRNGASPAAIALVGGGLRFDRVLPFSFTIGGGAAEYALGSTASGSAGAGGFLHVSGLFSRHVGLQGTVAFCSFGGGDTVAWLAAGLAFE